MLAFHPRHGHAPDHPGPHHDGKATVWIDLFNPSEAEIELVEDLTQLKVPALEDLRRIDRSSQMRAEGKMLSLAAPVIADAATDHPSLTYIGMILTPHVLVTVRFAELKVFETTAERVCGDHHPCPPATEVFVNLLEALIDREADMLEGARGYLDDISHQVFRAKADGVKTAIRSSGVLRERLQRLGRIGDRVSMIRESLMSVGRIAPFAREMGKSWIDADKRERLTAIAGDVESLNLFVEHLFGKVQFLLDAVVGLIGIEQNDIFKVLTIWSVVGIAPTLVAGIYGMNFKNMPEYDWHYGYQYGLGLLLVTTIAPLIWFKWRKWF
jgi:magnesium transporter